MSRRGIKHFRRRWAVGGLAGIALLSASVGAPAYHQVAHAAAWEAVQQTNLQAKRPLLLPLSPGAYAAALALPDPKMAVVDTTYLPVPRQAPRPTDRPPVVSYTVKPGDTIWALAAEYETDMDSILALNPDVEPELLAPGSTLTVPQSFRGVAYRVQNGDTLRFIASAHLSPLDEIMRVNGLTSDETPQPGRVLFLPGGRARNMVASRGAREQQPTAPSPAVATSPTPPPAATAAARPAPAPTPSSRATRATWVWPISGSRVFSEYGPREDGFHSGLDIVAPVGTLALAARSGVVVFAGRDGGYGQCVIIDHGKGMKTRYAHASILLVSVGQKVAQGDAVIKVGMTGRTTGPHLHFEVIADGHPQNPRNYLP